LIVQKGLELAENFDTIADRLHARLDSLTRAERQLADSILENYPVSGLGSITVVAHNAEVSTPTVARMVQKLGYKGFPDFQAELRKELEAKITGPIAKHDIWAGHAPEGHILNRFTEAVIGNIRQTLAHIETESFDATCALLADNKRVINIVGGRVTRSLADYLFVHMQMIRAGVVNFQSGASGWPHYLLDMKPGDVLVVFDVRRYENSTLKLAELAQSKGAEIVLFTDQWRSPVARYAAHCFNCRIVVPSAWDSSVATMLLLETVISAVQELNWSKTRPRMEELEELFNHMRSFRKFT
jgi:DNA-binding MurR/RpiR family transcriptional regulator